MAYLRRLIHSCAIWRPTTSKSSTGIEKAVMPNSATATVKCFLNDSPSKRMLEQYGADVRCDGVVFFPAGTDVRPSVEQAAGLNDKLVITDERGVVTTWLITGVHNPCGAQKMITAMVKRASR